MRLIVSLTTASLKIFFRQREAVIWTFILPVFMIVLFSFVEFGGVGTVSLGIALPPGGDARELVDGLRAVPSLEITTGSEAEERTRLEKGERDAVLVVPSPAGERTGGGDLTLLTSRARHAEGKLAAVLVQSVLDRMLLTSLRGVERPAVTPLPVETRHRSYIDFLLPGVLAMSIMQMGVFGVAFGFVSLKKRGILRRLSATPLRPTDFIIAQVIMRLFVVLLQVGVMIGLGVAVFDLHFEGSIGALLAVALPGAVVFLGIGFLLAGISRSEDQVAPLANIVTLPMILLSGVFFSRTNLPGLVHTITGFLPLTYLADGLRAIAIDGATLAATWPDLLGLAAWGIVACVAAIRFFRWE